MPRKPVENEKPGELKIKEASPPARTAHIISTAQSETTRLTESVKFIDGNTDVNFTMLRSVCGLNDSDHVSSLILGFSVHPGGFGNYEYRIGDGLYKIGLFLFWLSGSVNGFQMNDTKRKHVREFFGTQFCKDIMTGKLTPKNETEQTKHFIIQSLLQRDTIVATLKVKR